MDHPALSLAPEEQAKWDASEAIIQKREADLALIWAECNTRGQEAVSGVMEYLETIENQNRRLNQRINILEKMLLDHKMFDACLAAFEKFNTLIVEKPNAPE